MRKYSYQLKGLLAGLFFSILSIAGFAQGRVVKNINNGWKYLEKPYTKVDQAKSDERWQQIDLPHSWNCEDATDLEPGYRRSASWYRKTLNFSELSDGKRYFLYFEGANITTDVYVNDVRAGGHVGGYVGFEVELTKYLKSGDNEIMVRVDNGYDKEVIPSQKSDFFIYGGITRDVWLKEVSNTFISQIKVQTPKVSVKSAQTQVDLHLSGNLAKKSAIHLMLLDPKGKQVYESYKSLNKSDLSMDFKLPNPILWDVNAPNLYTLKVAYQVSGKTVDEVSEKIGYRWFEFKEHGPFYLNGKRLLLRGTHRHEEHAGVGPAMSNAMHRKDMEDIKNMGANFVRLGHYSQDPEVYKACDELGILVWDELPWCRGGVGNQQWKDNTSRLLKEMINQNYNHPSVIIWSLGNEIYWLPDFEDINSTEAMNEFLSELNDIAHSMDPGRKTAIRKYYEGSHIVDVFSPSIWSGWYSGTYKNYEQVINKSIEEYPHFLHMEYGGSSHLGRHTENPINGDGLVNPDEWEEPVNQIETSNVAKNGDWSENYIVDLFDWYLHVSETNPKLTGNAQWAFKDFGTPLRPENDIPYMNQKGVVDRAGHPKDAYYVFKSYWSDVPFAYIESHTWTERSGPKGKSRNVCVFSNAAKVELFLNGKSLGVKERDIQQYPACGLNWDIEFVEGENKLEAVGYAGDSQVKDNLMVNYTYEQSGSPEELKLSYELLENDHIMVTATAMDSHGKRSLDYQEKIYFQCLAGGTTFKNMGTPTGSEVIAMANGQASIEVVPDSAESELVMTVLNQNFKGEFLQIKMTDIGKTTSDSR